VPGLPHRPVNPAAKTRPIVGKSRRIVYHGVNTGLPALHVLSRVPGRLPREVRLDQNSRSIGDGSDHFFHGEYFFLSIFLG